MVNFLRLIVSNLELGRFFFPVYRSFHAVITVSITFKPIQPDTESHILYPNAKIFEELVAHFKCFFNTVTNACFIP